MRIAEYFLLFMLLIATCTAGKGGKGKGGKKCNEGKRGRRRLAKGNDDDERDTFDSGFYIAYVGPEEKFDESNFEAIAFLQDSIRDTYNGQIGCEGGIFAESVELTNQTLLSVVDSRERRRLQGKFGLTYSLLTFLTVKGSCANTCPNGNRIVGNDAARRLRRRLQSEAIDNFNTEIVVVLNTNEDFANVEYALISDYLPDILSESEDFLSDFNEFDTSQIVVSNSDDPYSTP